MIIPKRRAVGLTATVARTSAGALNYTPVAKVTNQSLDQRKIDKLIKIMQNKDVLNDVEKMI